MFLSLLTWKMDNVSRNTRKWQEGFVSFWRVCSWQWGITLQSISITHDTYCVYIYIHYICDICIKLCSYPCCRYHHLIQINYPISRMDCLQKLALKKAKPVKNETTKQKNPLQNRLHHHSKIWVQKKCEFWNIWNLMANLS